MTPTRVWLMVTRTQAGEHRFTVTRHRRVALRLQQQATQRGLTVVQLTPRFDFTLAKFGIPMDATDLALPGVTPPPLLITKPRTRKGGGSSTARAPKGPMFPPRPDPQVLKLEALVKLEEAIGAMAEQPGVATQEFKDKFERYQKVKRLALGSGGTTHEHASAFRRALIDAVQLVF